MLGVNRENSGPTTILNFDLAKSRSSQPLGGMYENPAADSVCRGSSIGMLAGPGPGPSPDSLIFSTLSALRPALMAASAAPITITAKKTTSQGFFPLGFLGSSAGSLASSANGKASSG